MLTKKSLAAAVGAAATAVAATLSACQPQSERYSHATMSPSATQATASNPASGAILAYKQMRKIEFSIESDATSSPNALDSVTTGYAKQVILEEIHSETVNGLELRGNITDAPSIDWISTTGTTSVAQIRDCMDLSRVSAIHASTGQAYPLPQQLLRYIATATASREPGGQWIITSIEADRSRPC